MRRRAVFIATTRQAAVYWAGQWGYRPQEVWAITPGNREACRGLRPEPGVPAFLCGPTAEGKGEIQLEEVLQEMQARGFVIRDAQEMGGEYSEVLPGSLYGDEEGSW